MALNLQNSSNWEIFYEQMFYTAQGSLPNSYIPIPIINLPLTCDSPWIMAAASSQTARAWWYLGFNLMQMIPGLSQEGQWGEFARYVIPLNRDPVLIEFKKPTTDYFLRIEVPHWHREMGVTIWQYIGPE